MQKPNGYDEAKASGEFTPVELGGHYCTIKQVSETKSSSGKDMIVVLFDFCPPDKQAGYFTKDFQADSRPDKKWPFAGSKWIMVNDYEDASKTSRQFKTFCSCVEKSNNYEIKWGVENWAQQFKGKKIGAVYGEEENEYNGKTFMRPAVKWFCRIDAVDGAAIPEPKYLKGKTAKAGSVVNTPTPKVDDGWMNMPEDTDEEIPF